MIILQKVTANRYLNVFSVVILLIDYIHVLFTSLNDNLRKARGYHPFMLCDICLDLFRENLCST